MQISTVLSSVGQPWVHSLTPGERDSEAVAALIATDFGACLNGLRMRTFDHLMDEYARVFAFPDHFGRNWAAFDEFITDLSWLPARSYLTVIANASEVMADELGDRPTYLRLIHEAGQTWGRSFALGPAWGGGEVPFNTVLME